MAHVTVRIEKSRLTTKHPAVIIPMKDWEKIEDLLEDLEALSSPRFLRSIETSRAQAKAGKVYTFKQVLQELS